jgi:hypothetical protein
MFDTWYRSLACITILSAALPTRAAAQVVINEVCPRPAGQEFLELHNSGASAIDLSGWSVGYAVRFTFPSGSWIAPGEYLVIARNPEILKSRGPAIPDGVRVFGWESGDLSAVGQLELLDASRRAHSSVDETVYSAEARGASLELLNPRLPTTSARAWQPSARVGGTPGARNSRFADAPIVLTEVPERGRSAAGRAQIAVWFSEKVRFVTASDLTVNGAPARSVSGAGAGPYVFDVGPLAMTGAATVSLGASGKIEGDHGVAFAGESWQYLSPSTILSLPDGAQGGPNANVQVPVSAAPADGIYSIDATIHYDPAILQAQSVATSGIGLTAGFSTFANLGTAGEILLSSYANSNALSGSGEFARIQFHVIGAPGTTSALTFVGASVNEGGILAGYDPGLFTVTCAGAANGTACNDGNGCTVNDTCQSGACAAGTAILAPAEISGVALGADKSAISWSAPLGAGPGVVYDVVRGLVGQWPAGAGAAETCLAPGIGATATSDATTPALQTSYWYLIRGRNTCGTGTYGTAETHGVPGAARTPNACP